MKANSYPAGETTDALALLVNEPQLLATLLPRAGASNVHAQCGIGLIYAEGRGVKPDPARGYAWLSRDMTQGDRDAETLRRMLVPSMSAADITRAERFTIEEKRR